MEVQATPDLRASELGPDPGLPGPTLGLPGPRLGLPWAGPDKVGDRATAGRRHRPNFVGTDVSKLKSKM